MRTMTVVSTLLGLAIAAGCQSAGTRLNLSIPASQTPRAAAPAAPKVAAVGRPVREMIAAAKGLRMEFFTLDDKKLDGLPEQKAGSVSIYAADGSGQDNYRFDATGRIDRHMRSYGEDFGAGVWKTVK